MGEKGRTGGMGGGMDIGRKGAKGRDALLSPPPPSVPPLETPLPPRFRRK